MFNKLLNLFRSLRFTIFLIICLTSVFLIGLMVPQKDLLGRELYLKWKSEKPALVSFLEALDFTEIYISPITIALWGLFFLNLLFIMSNRIPNIWRRCFKEDLKVNMDSLKGSRNYEVIDGVDIKNAGDVLKDKGYKVLYMDNALHAVKNRLSPLATILFHLSFFLLLSGGVISFYTRFIAEAEVAVGETFSGQYTKLKRPKIGGIPTTTFVVEAIEPTYYKKDLPVDLKVMLSTKKGRRIIGINKPYNEGSLSFVIKKIDVAPLFVITDKAGREIDGAYVKVKGLSGTEDFFKMVGYNFRTVFYTDIYAASDSRLGKSNLPQALKQSPLSPQGKQLKEIVNPAFNIAVFKEGRLLRAKTIQMAETIEFDGKKLIFKDLTYWVSFLVVKEQGLGIVYTGFILMTTALIIRFGFYRRDLKGIIEGGRLHIGGRAEYFTSQFADEFKWIIGKIKGV